MPQMQNSCLVVGENKCLYEKVVTHLNHEFKKCESSALSPARSLTRMVKGYFEMVTEGFQRYDPNLNGIEIT